MAYITKVHRWFLYQVEEAVIASGAMILTLTDIFWHALANPVVRMLLLMIALATFLTVLITY